MIYNFNRSTQKTISIIFMILVLSGCGGGSTSSTDTSTVTLSGKIIDGEISGATVFLDLNRNGVLGSDEPTGESDGNGTFTLTLTAAHKNHKNYLNKKAPLVIYGGVDIRTGNAFEDYLTAIIEDENATNITPLSTLIAETLGEELDNDVNNSLNNIEAKMNEIKENLADLLDIKKELLTKNPIDLAKEGDVSLIDVSLQMHKVAKKMKKAMKKEVKDLRRSILKSYRAMAKSLKKLKKSAIKSGDTALVTALDEAFEDNELFDDEFKATIKEESKDLSKDIRDYWRRNRVSLSDDDVTTVLNGVEIIIVDANSSIVNDIQAPKIIRLGRKNIKIVEGDSYEDRGAIARDNKDGNVTGDIITVNPVDANTIGTYTITYDVSDAAGNKATQVSRTVTVIAKEVVVTADKTKPVITLIGDSSISITKGIAYTDAGATASDNKDGDISSIIVVNNSVNINRVGIYTVTYDVNDTAGNKATQVSRTVTVIAKEVVVTADKTKPVITLVGASTISLVEGSTYNDAGATASDNKDGNISSKIVVNNSVNINTVGTYTVTYDVSDTAGNKATQVTRTVKITAKPIVVIERLNTAATDISLRPIIKEALGYSFYLFTDKDQASDVGSSTVAFFGKLKGNESQIVINNVDARYEDGSKFQVIVKDSSDKIVGLSKIFIKKSNDAVDFGIIELDGVSVIPYSLEKFKSVLSKSDLQWQSKEGSYDIKSDIEGVSTSYFYLTNNEHMTFEIANSGQKRVELRQKETWLSTRDVELTGNVKCYTPTALKEYTFTQLFNKSKNNPSLRLLWHDKRSGKSKHLWAYLKTDAGEIKTDLGENPDGFFDVKVSIFSSNLTIKINNEVKVTQNIANDSYWAGDFYFKAGAYISGSINDAIPEGSRGVRVDFDALSFEKINTIDIAHKYGKATQGTQSNYQYYRPALNAIDNNDSTNNHTSGGKNGKNWLQIELPSPTIVSKIVLKNRSHSSRITNAKLYLLDAPYTGTVDASDLVKTLDATTSEQVITLDPSVSGTYVLIKGEVRSQDDRHIHLTKLEVYGQMPSTPVFNAYESKYLIQGTTSNGTVITRVSAVDYQEDTLTYSIVEDVPFTINSSGEISVNGGLSASDYTFSVQVSDGVNSTTTSVTVNVTSATVIADVLASGDVVKTKVTEEELIQATLDEIEATKTFLHDAKVKIFTLDTDGSAKGDGSSLTSIDWNPTHDASIILPTLGKNSAFLYTNAVTDVSKTVYKKEIGILGEKGNARYIVFGSNPLRNGVNDEMNKVIEHSMAWLTGRDDLKTTTFNVVLAHLDDSHYFRDETKTREWLDTHYAGQVSYNSANTCEGTALVGCLASSPDLLIISQVSSASDDSDAIALAVNNALKNGVSVLYVHHNGNQKTLGKALFSSVFDVTYEWDNYWKKLKLEAYNPTADMNVLSEKLVKIKTMFTHFKAKDYAFDWSVCTDSSGNMGENNDNCNDVTGLSSEFQQGANQVRDIINKLDHAKKNIFNESGYKIQKLLALTSDKFRQSVVYPMDKVTTDNSEFMKSYYADHAIYNYRAINPVQPNMGNFSRSGFSHITPVTKTVNLTSKKSFRSTGAYALPGQTVKVTRNDSSDLTVKVQINTLRSGATHQYQKNGYKRPKYLTTPYFELKTGETVEFTSPYGGTLQLSFNKNELPVEVTFQNVGEHPYWASSADNASFAAKMSANEYDWAEIATSGFEVHSKIEKMQQSIDNAKWGSAEALAQGVYDYTSNYPHVLAGFKGDGVDVVAEIHDWSTSKGLTIETIDTMKHMNADQATCGYGCSGNPYDAYWAFDPIGHGDIHEMGHSMQKKRFEGFPNHAATNTFSYYTKARYFANTGTDPDCQGLAFKNIFDIVQSSVGESNVTSYLKTNLWDVAGLGQQYLLKIEAFMHAQKLGKLDNGWHVLARVHILEREMSRAKKDWDAKKASVGFGTYSLDEINAIRDNDWLMVAYSYASELDLRNYFDMMGMPHSAKAYTQIASFGFDVVPNSLFVSTSEGYCKTDDYGTIFDRPTLDMNGSTVYPY